MMGQSTAGYALVTRQDNGRSTAGALIWLEQPGSGSSSLRSRSAWNGLLSRQIQKRLEWTLKRVCGRFCKSESENENERENENDRAIETDRLSLSTQT